MVSTKAEPIHDIFHGKDSAVMGEKISGISLKTMFQHEGYGCLCAKDTVNTSPDEAPTVTLKVCQTGMHICCFPTRQRTV